MPSTTTHARSHALLLLQKLLNLRDNASPLTLVLDSLEQSGKPIAREFLHRAKIAKSKTIFVSFSTLRKPHHVDVFIKARGQTTESLCSEIVSHYPASIPGQVYRVLLLFDTLNPLASSCPSSLPSILGSLITPAVSIVGVYHTDVPLVHPTAGSTAGPGGAWSEYEPHPLAVLTHLATAVLSVSSLYQAVERRKARDRSLQEPEWGLSEGREGVLVGLGRRQGPGSATSKAGDPTGNTGEDLGGLVLEMELRRRSGRAVSEKFVFIPAPVPASTAAAAAATPALSGTAKLALLSDHPLLRSPGGDDDGADNGGDGEEPESTFNLGLTDKQRRDREGIVLPYFDAQTDIGAGEGGRILYDMGREDDFDEEEDEILYD